MSAGVLIDIIIVLLALLFAINGYRQGFIVGALAFAGFFGGALIGVQLAPLLLESMESALARVIVALAVVFGIAVFGQWACSTIGIQLRTKLRRNGAKKLDELGGAVVSVVAVLLVAWMAAAPLGNSGLPGMASAVRNSLIVGTVDERMPEAVRGVYDSLRDSLNTNGFPEVFSGLDPTQTRDVPPPDAELAASPVVQNSEASVLKVLGDAPECNRRIEGSSFVYDDELVLTNAHVVAGTEYVEVETAEGRMEARVVVFDDRRDLAVLWVKGLTAPPLEYTSEPAESGEDTIVLGYPQGGPYTATPSRVREERNVTGPDIYGEREVTREVYALRAQVISGNSGGPLLSQQGVVQGVIFAAAVDDPETGYALTMDEAAPVLEAAEGRFDAVSTQGCT